jgi:iron complex outermembrane receptor protein
MRTRQFSKVCVLLSGAGAAALMSDAVRAQSTPDSVPVLEEVIVTAEHREQRLLDVPAAISVLSSSSLEAKNALDFRDYLTTVPGVNFTQGNIGQMRVAIRGISDGVSSYDPLTGIYIDEAPVTEGYAPTLDPDIYDLERVEVLKGPQGTLYGAGSMGGTVRIITKKPVLNTYQASADATVSDTEGGGVNERVDLAVNVPILEDRMALRLSGGYRHDAGWIDDIKRHVEDANDVDKRNFHGQLLLRPDENTSVILSLLYQKAKAGQPDWEDIGLGDYQTARAYSAYTDIEAKLYSLTIQHDTDWMSVSSATNYVRKNTGGGADFTSTVRGLLAALSHITLGPSEGVGLLNRDAFDGFTQEVRLASRGKHVLDWTLGGFYSYDETNFGQAVDFSAAPSTQGVVTGPGFLQSAQTYSTKQVAGFGELTYNITDRIAATGGGRVFNVLQQTTVVGSGILNGGNTQSQAQANNSSQIGKFALKYQPSADNMLYAQAAQGYRNGVPTGATLPPVCLPQAAALGYTTIPQLVRPDSLWNYEIGSKNRLMQGRATINVAAFYIDWKDIQSSVSLPCGGGFSINGGRAVSEGGEFEGTVQPLEGLTLTGSATYVDAYLSSPAPGVRANPGDRLPDTSKWSANASAQYETRVTNTLNGFIRGEANYVGDRWNNFRAIGAPRAVLMDPYTTLTLRLGLSHDNWTAALFGTNLTNRHVVLLNSGTTYREVAAPRTIGLNVRYDYEGDR